MNIYVPKQWLVRGGFILAAVLVVVQLAVDSKYPIPNVYSEESYRTMADAAERSRQQHSETSAKLYAIYAEQALQVEKDKVAAHYAATTPGSSGFVRALRVAAAYESLRRKHVHAQAEADARIGALIQERNAARADAAAVRKN